MFFRPRRDVVVRSREALDAALASPNPGEIVVEGDAGLLTYAARKASDDPDLSITRFGPEPRDGAVDFDPFDLSDTRPEPPGKASGGITPAPANDPGTDPFDDPDRDFRNAYGSESHPEPAPPPPAPPPTGAPPLSPADRDPFDVFVPSAPPASRSWAGALVAMMAGAVILLLGIVGYLTMSSTPAPAPSSPGPVVQTPPQAPPWIDLPQQSERPSTTPPSQAPPPQLPPATHQQQPPYAGPSTPTVPTPASPAPGSPQGSAWLWPVVALAAIVALFFTARQAIAGGSSVEVNLKVTKVFEGKLVIEKKVSRAPRKAA